jgi:acyl-lipid omega-6 desaturase (Delta-12 desaturase)
MGAVMPQMNQILSGTKAFQAPILARSLGQLATSFGGFFITCAVMYLTFAMSLWITLALSVLAAGFLVRIFIIQHDCGHGSFFRSRRANELIGSLCSLMTLTPYAFWRRQHARHHGSWNNLDRRAASGLDIYSSCMTVAEYRALGRSRRCLVRLTNHPIVANLLLPPLVFVILYRVPFDAAKGWRRERRGVYLTNLALTVLVGGLGLALGYGRVAAVQLPIMVIASIVGVWLFSIQHRFEHAQWMPDASWSFAATSLGGTSYLRLPRLLQWFTGNIGFHHVHHVNPRIPNYRLEQMPQRRFRVSIGVNAYAARSASGLALRIVGQRSGATSAVSLRRCPLVDICGASTSIRGLTHGQTFHHSLRRGVHSLRCPLRGRNSHLI